MRYLLVLLLLATPAYAEVQSAEQRLAVQIANMSLALARAGEQIDKLKAQVEDLQTKLDAAQPKDKKDGSP